MVWIHAITDGQKTTRMNPVSDAKLRMLADHIKLSKDERVLDIGAGRCGPTLMYVRERGCTVTAVEPHADFLNDARAYVAHAGLTDRFIFIEGKGTDATFELDSFDVAMCLGATFAYGGLDGTLDALTPLVRRGGHVVCGEPFRDVSGGTGPHDLTLREIVDRFETRGLAVISVIRSSDDDWDEYNSVRVRRLLDWVEANAGHPDADEMSRRRQDHATNIATRDMGWAIVSGRKM
jgi:precorrin-6B methylase 2